MRWLLLAFLVFQMTKTKRLPEWPVPLNSGWRISSTFDDLRNRNGNLVKHAAIDIAVPPGPLLAPTNQTKFLGTKTNEAGGLQAFWDLGGGFTMGAAHLAAVEPGTRFGRGETIAWTGKDSDDRTGHVHLTIYQNGKRIDPLAYFTEPGDEPNA